MIANKTVPGVGGIRYIVRDKDGHELGEGDTVTSFRGEKAQLIRVDAAPRRGKPAKVTTTLGTHYSTVYGVTVTPDEPAGSPYNTGARLEPHPWVQDGITGSENSRPAEANDYGRVDFDDGEGTTIATLHIEGSAIWPEDAFVLKLDVNAPVIIHGPGGECIGIVNPM